MDHRSRMSILNERLEDAANGTLPSEAPPRTESAESLIGIAKSASVHAVADAVHQAVSGTDMQDISEIHKRGGERMGGMLFSLRAIERAKEADAATVFEFAEAAFDPSDPSSFEMLAADVTALALAAIVRGNETVAGLAGIEFVARILPETLVADIAASLGG